MDQKQPRRRLTLNILLRTVVALIVLLLLLLFFTANFFYDFALNPQSAHQFIRPISRAELEHATPEAESGPFMAADPVRWINTNASTARLTSRDGLRLFAYEVLQPGSRYVILCHGYKDSALGMGSPASHFYRAGYSVLLPDARGHGGSEGTYVGMGWHERLDLLDWIDRIIRQNPEAEIALYGISMGAATVMMASGEVLPPQVKCVIEDCGYTSAWDEFSGQLKHRYHLPSFPIMNTVDIITQVRAGYRLKEASALAQVARSSTPTLFIHGSADTFVPFEMLDRLYSAASCEKEKLVIPGAAHAASMHRDPKAYWSAVDAFLERHYSPMND